MRKLLILFFIHFSIFIMAQSTFYNIPLNDINGDPINLFDFQGKMIMVVNVASKCGFTSQYEDLELLYQKYKEDLIIIGVPCNQFCNQEPGNSEEIKAFCTKKYNVSFILTEKLEVKGKNQHPLYEWLTNKELNLKKNSSVKWNFQKYLINRNGEYLDYFFSTTKPKSKKIINLIEQ